MDTITVSGSLAHYQSNHTIKVALDGERVVCAVDGIRVYQNHRNDHWRHDRDQVNALLDQEYRNRWPGRTRIPDGCHICNEPLRDGLYIRVQSTYGPVPVCDNCVEKAD